MLLASRPKPETVGLLLVRCPLLLIQYIHSHPPYYRLFLLPQTEDAPCCGGRDRLICGMWG